MFHCTSPMFHLFLLAGSVFMSLVCRLCLEIGSLSESASHHKFMIPFNSHSGTMPSWSLVIYPDSTRYLYGDGLGGVL